MTAPGEKGASGAQAADAVDRDAPTVPAVPRPQGLPREPRLPAEALATGDWTQALAELARQIEIHDTRLGIVEGSLPPPPSASLAPAAGASLTPLPPSGSSSTTSTSAPPPSRPSVAARAAAQSAAWTRKALQVLGALVLVAQLLAYFLRRRNEVGPLPAALEILQLALRGGGP